MKKHKLLFIFEHLPSLLVHGKIQGSVSRLPFFYKARDLLRSSQISEEFVPAGGKYEGLVLSQVPKCDIIKNDLMQKEVISETEIFATPERVWQIILKSQNVPIKQLMSWRTSKKNGLISFSFVGIRGNNKSRAVLTRFSQNSELGWMKKFYLIPGLLKNETFFQIIQHVDGVGITLLHRERFQGIFVPFLKSRILSCRSEIQLSSAQIRENAEDIS